MIAIIGGSGLTRLPEMNLSRRQIVRTPYGLPSSTLLFGNIGKLEVVFLARHGFGHTIAPHKINYRANVWALHSVGARSIISAAAVYSMNEAIRPGSLVLPSDILDYSYDREHTFYQGEHQQVLHTAFDEPYDSGLKKMIAAAATKMSPPDIKHQAVYACLQGPRFPSKAEVQRLIRDGADVFGMTGMPEAILAKELGMRYVHLCGVIAWAPGMEDTCTTCSRAPSDETEYQAIAHIRALLAALNGEKPADS